MACEILVGYSTDDSEEVEVDDETSTRYSRIDGRNFTSDNETSVSGPVDSGDESADEYCQCPEEYTLVECLTCGSLFDIETYCPGC
jgi:hypothetical protein